ncbi:hypothetical protein ABZ946_28435 [Streptomyces sp. NPDC046324]|uniref:hypothetical protein n=1 Tax=unclassified Streptomyces TaxID=2593676 RepID=UPI0033F6C66B
MSKLWEEGKKKGIYATERSKSGVAAMFSRPDLPNGEALMDLVALIMIDFMRVDEAAVKREQQRFRQLREAAAAHRDAPPVSGLVAELQEVAARYNKLAENVQYAEFTAVVSHVPQRRRDAFEFAIERAVEFLGADDPVVRRLRERADEVSAPNSTP